jgi:hypothetical protein
VHCASDIVVQRAAYGLPFAGTACTPLGGPILSETLPILNFASEAFCQQNRVDSLLYSHQMSDQPPQAAAATGKKKRKVKKKPEATAEAAAPPTPQPRQRYQLTLEDREHFDYIREATSKNVWYASCLAGDRFRCNLHTFFEI